MDLRLTAKVPATAEERAAVDAVLGPPASGWDGGARRGRSPRRVRRPRRPRAPPPAHHRAARACRTRSAGSARARSTTSASGSTCPRPRRTASLASTRSSAPSRRRARSCTSATTWPAGQRRRAALRGDDPPVRRRGDRDRPSTARASPGSGPRAWASATAARPRSIQQRAAATPARRGLAPATPELALAGADRAGGRSQIRHLERTLRLRPVASTRLSRAGPVSLLRRVGRVDPASLGSYRAAGGYQMLRRAFELGPQGVIREVRDAKLMGRGGAAFPTAQMGSASRGNRSGPTTWSATPTSRSPAPSRTAC